MMKKYFALALLFLSIQNSIAGTRIYAGSNVSILNTSDSYYRFGSIIGIEKTWETPRNSISFGIQYIIRASYLKNKTMVFLMSDHGYHFDALFSVGYLELPLIYSMKTRINEAFRINVNVGPSLAISIKDYSKSHDSEDFIIENNLEFRQNHPDYYIEYDDPGLLYFQSNSSFFLNAGFVVEYRNIFLEPRYSHALNGLEILKGLNMKGEKFRTFEFLFGIHI